MYIKMAKIKAQRNKQAQTPLNFPNERVKINNNPTMIQENSLDKSTLKSHVTTPAKHDNRAT